MATQLKKSPARSPGKPGAPSQSLHLVKCGLLNEDTKKSFFAYFNPKEISWDKSVPWQQHPKSKGDHPLMEFTGAKASQLSVELFFDTYESKANVHSEFILPLQELATVHQIGKLLRPPMVVFFWGDEFPRFKGVIESLAVKYTMFLPSGRPVRATATLKITHAGITGSKVSRPKGNDATAGGAGGAPQPGERGHDPRSS